MRIVLAILAVVVVVIGAAAAALEFQWMNPSRAAVEARYADADSQFVEIDGVRLHYKDQGQGFPLLLWHGNWGNLSFYDGWVEQLQGKYRLIRLDIPGFGLTGPDPSGDYSIERRLQLATALLDRLGVDAYAVVGTSLAAPAAYRAAAEQPDRVKALLLINAGGLPRPDGAINQPLPNPVLQWITVRHKPMSFWQDSIPRLYKAQARTPEQLREFHDMNQIQGRGFEGVQVLGQFDIGDVPAILAQIRQPTLVMWTEFCILPVSEADRYLGFLANAPTERVVLPGIGHMFADDDPVTTAAEADRFLTAALAPPQPMQAVPTAPMTLDAEAPPPAE